MGLRYMPPRGGSGAPRLRGWRGLLSAAFRACHALVPAAPKGGQANITFTDATITINDDDAAPSGITLSVDTNGSTSGTPSTVAEDAGATVVTVTATVNGTTRYVDAKTVAVSVDDGTAESPADYAAVSGFNITIAAGAASQSGSFTVTPVDDDLDEANETIDVTGTLTDITITAATVTLTDTDDPVSFSIADAEATEGGKVEFTVSREGAGDNVASVKVTTATDSGDGADAADADDYTAIATAQTLNFAKGVASQTVEVQTTQDDLFEPDETFKAVLSAPALGENDPGTGVSIESGKGTATGTIKNDDTEPSFAVADASASEGDAITFTVTRSGAMDNAVSVKWNTKAATGAGAASISDYTAVTAPATLTFAKGVSSQTFTVATTEDTLDEGNETFLVELTGAVGGTIATAEATGTINDDDAAPSGITLSVDTNGSTAGTPSTVAEDAGATVVTVTATVNGTTRYVDAKTVVVSVDDGTAESPADYAAVSGFNITIAAGAASQSGSFTVTPVDDDLDEANETIDVTGTLTPTDDDLHEGSETIDVTGTSNALTITKASITLEDDDAQPSFAVADASASEGDAITFTVTRSGAMDNAVSVKWNTKAATGAGAASTTDYTAMPTATKLDFAKGVGSQTFAVATTEDTLNEANETFLIELTDPVGITVSTLRPARSASMAASWPGRNPSNPNTSLSTWRAAAVGSSNVRISAETGRGQPGIRRRSRARRPLQRGGRPEFENLGGLDPDRFARPRIAALARRTPGNGEGAEVADGVAAFLLRLLQPGLDLAQDKVDRALGLRLAHVALRGDVLDECGSAHDVWPLCFPNRNCLTRPLHIVASCLCVYYKRLQVAYDRGSLFEPRGWAVMQEAATAAFLQGSRAPDSRA